MAFVPICAVTLADSMEIIKGGEKMKVAIIGGGASGLCCAIEAAKNNNQVTIYEAKERVGKKILATGNGRCNMLNSLAKSDDYSSPSFVHGVLSQCGAENVRHFFEDLGLYVRFDDEGRAYPLSNQASSVLDALRLECERLKVRVLCENTVTEIKRKGKSFIVLGEAYDKVVLCCGSKAAVKGFNGYELLKSLGHNIINPMPGLTKLTVKDKTFTKQLKGVRHKAVLTLYIDNEKVTKEKGEILFADYGLSGIAIMQLSSIIARSFATGKKVQPSVKCDFVPDMSFNELTDKIKAIASHNGKMKCENLLSGFMPKKLGEVVVKGAKVPIGKEIGQLSEKDIKAIAFQAKSFSFEIEALRPFEDAQIACGGASTREFNKYTLESLKHSGLYACGEILDVDGPCGGYNLLWAFASGIVVGRQINNDKNK